MSQLVVNNLSVRFDDFVAVNNLSFQLAAGEIGCLLGPSGCGKTTVLRTIAGFELPSDGEVILGNQLVSSSTQFIATEQRRVGLVFQDFALFPHLSIKDNIAFGLNHLNSGARKQRVIELLEWVNLSDLIDKYPHQLENNSASP